MGCLIEFIFEVIGEAILEGWMALMQWCVPRKSLSHKVSFVLRTFVNIFSVVLLCMLVGLIMWVSEDRLITQIGKYMLLICLGISAVQISLGLIVRLIIKK